jgi:hypothetical protein
MTVEKLQDLFKGNAPKPKASKLKDIGGGDFSGMLDAVSAMGPTMTTASQLYGSSNSSAVLSAAFSGITNGAQTLAGSTPTFASGNSGGYNLGAQYASTSGTIGTLDSNASVVPGTEGFSQMDMINTMNQNNLQLLELQATMQSNMQEWNTKSNILSADHRARMAMIEKFTARG